MIATFHPTSREYKNLEAAAALLTALSPHGTKYRVEETYFDAGQDWRWTTIIAHRLDGSTWQALNPREQNMITDIGTLESITEAVRMVINGKYNPDRKEV